MFVLPGLNEIFFQYFVGNLKLIVHLLLVALYALKVLSKVIVFSTPISPSRNCIQNLVFLVNKYLQLFIDHIVVNIFADMIVFLES